MINGIKFWRNSSQTNIIVTLQRKVFTIMVHTKAKNTPQLAGPHSYSSFHWDVMRKAGVPSDGSAVLVSSACRALASDGWDDAAWPGMSHSTSMGWLAEFLLPPWLVGVPRPVLSYLGRMGWLGSQYRSRI